MVLSCQFWKEMLSQSYFSTSFLQETSLLSLPWPSGICTPGILKLPHTTELWCMLVLSAFLVLQVPLITQCWSLSAVANKPFSEPSPECVLELLSHLEAAPGCSSQLHFLTGRDQLLEISLISWFFMQSTFKERFWLCVWYFWTTFPFVLVEIQAVPSVSVSHFKSILGNWA